jgi:hypothetical protein
VGLRAGLDAGARRKILCPCQGSNPDRPACSQTLYSLSYRGSIIIKIIITITIITTTKIIIISTNTKARSEYLDQNVNSNMRMDKTTQQGDS